MRACKDCPFENFKDWGFENKDQVYNKVVEVSDVPLGTPQVCHMIIKTKDPNRESYIPRSEDEICIGHLNYLKEKNGISI